MVGGDVPEDLMQRASAALHTGAITEFEGKAIKSRATSGISKKRFYAQLFRQLAVWPQLDQGEIHPAILAFAHNAVK